MPRRFGPAAPRFDRLRRPPPRRRGPRPRSRLLRPPPLAAAEHRRLRLGHLPGRPALRLRLFPPDDPLAGRLLPRRRAVRPLLRTGPLDLPVPRLPLHGARPPPPCPAAAPQGPGGPP